MASMASNAAAADAIELEKSASFIRLL